ncbi:MAG: PaaI family thioesterase [Acidimicrobiia bacterium]
MDTDGIDAPAGDEQTGTQAADAAWTEHFIGALGLELWAEDGFTHGRAVLRPEMWAPGTEVPRLGVLATMVDVVVGMPPTGALNPTVDLRLTLLSLPPAQGPIRLVCRPVKHGSRLFVGEALLYVDDLDDPFARATSTFMNRQVSSGSSSWRRRDVPPRIPTFDELLRARVLSQGVLEMDAHPGVSNGPGGTIQGGAQALLGEVAAEHALEPLGRYATVDLEIRFLNRVRSESVVATAEILPGDLAGVQVRVPLRETGPDGRIVSLVSTTCRAL